MKSSPRTSHSLALVSLLLRVDLILPSSRVDGAQSATSAPAETVIAGASGTMTIAGDDAPPPAPREFRGAWVATVGNIDWPSKPGLPVAQQQAEIITILDRLVELNMNVAVLQVRTAADALYDSKLEPWSFVLTGREGQAPDPYYDPLQFWVTEAHRRGIELHTWFNPYRARVGKTRESWAYAHGDTHVAKTHPDWVADYVSFEWIDPGNKEALAHTLAVFKDVVDRYDIDGVHMDDYFYPYPDNDPATRKEKPFPDDASWKTYKDSGGTLARDDWRRQNVDTMVHQLYVEIKKAKPWVKLGISPFGIWREYNPPGVSGFSMYDKLYADGRLWLNNGWVDYWTPQLYWKISYPRQNYLSLLNWWIKENKHHRVMVPGLFTGQVRETADSATAWTADAICDQIGINRALAPAATGEVHFPMNALLSNQGNIGDFLMAARGLYADEALPPAFPWLDGTPPAAPSLKLQKAPDTAAIQLASAPRPASPSRFRGRGRRRSGSAPADTVATQPTTQEASGKALRPIQLPPPAEGLVRTGCFEATWQSAPGEPVWLYAVYTKAGDTWTLHVYPAGKTSAVFYDTKSRATSAQDGTITMVAVSALDRCGNESARTIIRRTPDVTTPIAPPPARQAATTQPTTAAP